MWNWGERVCSLKWRRGIWAKQRRTRAKHMCRRERQAKLSRDEQIQVCSSLLSLACGAKTLEANRSGRRWCTLLAPHRRVPHNACHTICYNSSSLLSLCLECFLTVSWLWFESFHWNVRAWISTNVMTWFQVFSPVRSSTHQWEPRQHKCKIIKSRSHIILVTL